MSMTVDQLVSAARQLTVEQRSELLDRLGEVMHGEVPPEVADEWNRLASERLAAVEEGRAQIYSGDEVLARMRQRIGR